jgi:hypothetical protein
MIKNFVSMFYSILTYRIHNFRVTNCMGHTIVRVYFSLELQLQFLRWELISVSIQNYLWKSALLTSKKKNYNYKHKIKKYHIIFLILSTNKDVTEETKHQWLVTWPIVRQYESCYTDNQTSVRRVGTSENFPKRTFCPIRNVPTLDRATRLKQASQPTTEHERRSWNATCFSLAASTPPSARFLIDVHISSNDLAQFFRINYFSLSELNHLHEMETRAANGGFPMACSCCIQADLLLKRKKLQRSVPDVPAGGSVPFSSKVREDYWRMYLSGISSRCEWHGVECGGDGAAGAPRGQELQNTDNNSLTTVNWKEKAALYPFINPERQLSRYACEWGDIYVNNSCRISKWNTKKHNVEDMSSDSLVHKCGVPSSSSWEATSCLAYQEIPHIL